MAPVEDIRTMFFKDAEGTQLAEYGVDYQFIEKRVDQNVNIFIPALNIEHNNGCEWTKTLGDHHPYQAYYLCFIDNEYPGLVTDEGIGLERYGNIPIRPVC